MQIWKQQHLTCPFPFLLPRDQEIGQFHVDQERRATESKAPKLWMGRSGSNWEMSLTAKFSKNVLQKEKQNKGENQNREVIYISAAGLVEQLFPHLHVWAFSSPFFRGNSAKEFNQIEINSN